MTDTTTPGRHSDPEAPLAITHALLIDGNDGPPVEDRTVVVRHGQIEAIGPSSELAPPSGSFVIEGSGKAVMPGLADMHVHLIGAWDGESVDLLGYQHYLDALLHAGVTTVLDTGNFQPYILQLRQEIGAGRVRGPRLYCVGPVVDGTDPTWPAISVAVTSATQIPRLVERLAKDKVDFIKAYHGLPDMLIRALAAEGQKHGVRVLMDAGGRNGSADVLRAGIGAFAHAGWRETTDDAIRLAVDLKVPWITTLSVYESFNRRRVADLTFLDHPLWAESVPPRATAAVRDLAERVAKGEPSPYPALETGFPVAMRNVSRMHRAGIMLVAGTDAPYPGVPQGEGLHRELELLVESGLTPLEAITCATRNAARLVNGADQWGTLEPGKTADLLMIDGRPDRRICDTRNIRAVIQAGRLLDREAMRRELAAGPATRPFSPGSWA